jgi:YesN/AraC family two-component response regulator
MELWKPVPIKPFDQVYQVSSKGNLKSLKKPKRKFILQGYFYTELSYKGFNKKFKVSRLVALAFISNPENKEQVNHKNGNKLCDEVNNLEWNTRSENMKHAFKMGLHSQRGEQNAHSKLTRKQANQIRKLYKKDFSQKELAKKFNTNQSNISRIVNNIIWI